MTNVCLCQPLNMCYALSYSLYKPMTGGRRITRLQIPYGNRCAQRDCNNKLVGCFLTNLDFWYHISTLLWPPSVIGRDHMVVMLVNSLRTHQDTMETNAIISPLQRDSLTAILLTNMWKLYYEFCMYASNPLFGKKPFRIARRM